MRYVCISRFGGTSTSAYTRTQARGATPELRRVADTTSYGLSAGRYSTKTTCVRVYARVLVPPNLNIHTYIQTTIGSPSLCVADQGEERGGSHTILGLELAASLGL